jgi:hypothetical protein
MKCRYVNEIGMSPWRNRILLLATLRRWSCTLLISCLVDAGQISGAKRIALYILAHVIILHQLLYSHERIVINAKLWQEDVFA